MPEPNAPREDEETLEQVIEAETAPKARQPHAHSGQPEGFLDRAWKAQDRLEQKWQGIGSGRFARVLRMARKPEPEEFRQSSTIVLVGIGVIGGIGFVIYLFMAWLLKVLGA
jgi:protein transport protein SEC61 subunit gamma and related proteins